MKKNSLHYYIPDCFHSVSWKFYMGRVFSPTKSGNQLLDGINRVNKKLLIRIICEYEPQQIGKIKNVYIYFVHWL